MCSIEGCPDTGRVIKTYCRNHYYRWKRHGDPLALGPPALAPDKAPPGTATAYYWAHVDDETDDCVEWPFGTTDDGYGRLGQHRVHILACERHHGPRPPGNWIAASHAPLICHNRLCFNYRHLSWKTYRDNNLDMLIDGTYSPPPPPTGQWYPRKART